MEFWPRCVSQWVQWIYRSTQWIFFRRSWQKSYQSPLTFRIRNIMGKVKLKTKTVYSNISFPFPAKIGKHYHIPNVIEEISAILKDWKDAGSLAHLISTFSQESKPLLSLLGKIKSCCCWTRVAAKNERSPFLFLRPALQDSKSFVSISNEFSHSHILLLWLLMVGVVRSSVENEGEEESWLPQSFMMDRIHKIEGWIVWDVNERAGRDLVM